jgi:hypothetical protein
LHPGQSGSKRELVILRGDRLRAVVTIASVGSKTVPDIQVRSPTLHVRLVSAVKPLLVLQTTPFMQATIRPTSAYETRPPLEMYYVRCPAGGAPRAVGSAYGLTAWTLADPAVRGVYRFPAFCGQPLQWQLVVGWLNHPVVSVNYLRKG